MINENLHITTNIKLRDAIHDIMVSDLKPGDEMTLIELREKLTDFNIEISIEILNVLIFENWWKKNDYSIFRESDKKWLDLWPVRKTIELKKKYKINPPLGKSSRKISKSETHPPYNYRNNKRNYFY
jgi:hypothetical protein